MRITQNMMSGQVLSNITKSMKELAKVEEQLATGKLINRPSDDPLNCTLAMRFQSSLDALDAYQEAAAAGVESLEEASASLEQVSELLTQAKETAVEGSSDTSEESAESLAAQVNELLEDLLSTANTQSNGRYIFGGTQTDTEPFTATRDSDGNITAVAANPLGIDGSMNAAVAEGTVVQTNIGGEEVFTGDVDLFATLIDLRDALTAGDTTTVAASLDSLSTGIGQVESATGTVAVSINRLEAIQARNEEKQTRLESLLSQVRDADVSELYLDLQNKENAFEASLSAASSVLQLSLVDYLS